jgi:antitoxin component of MazEF toxin-antitoxin module
MPQIKQLSQIGNSRGVILDKVLLQQVDIDPNGEIELSIRDGAIVITPHRYASDDAARTAFRKIAKARPRMMERLAKSQGPVKSESSPKSERVPKSK